MSAFITGLSGVLIGAAIVIAVLLFAPAGWLIPPQNSTPKQATRATSVIQDNQCGWTTASSRHALDACSP